MTRNVLVTGGAGYVGSHVCKALATRGYTPVTFDNLSRGHDWAVRWGPLVHADLADRAALDRAFDEFDIAAVMHFAAYAYVGESMDAPSMYFDNNVVNSLRLLDTMMKRGVKTIIFSSSCATYGVPDEMPITERSPQSPINPYGETKLIIEKALRWYGSQSDLCWMALRYFNAAGADPDGEIGEDHRPETHLIPLVLQTALGERAAVQMFGSDYQTPDGSAVRDYIHVSDLADAHVRALDHLLRGGQSACLNLGTGTGISVREIVQAAESVTGMSITVENAARRHGDPAVLVADPARARDVLDWKPRFSDLETIISTAWEWHKTGMFDRSVDAAE